MNRLGFNKFLHSLTVRHYGDREPYELNYTYPKCRSWVHNRANVYPFSHSWVHIRANMYPFSHSWVHIRANMYPFSRFWVHIRANMYPFSHLWVHIQTNVYKKNPSRNTKSYSYHINIGYLFLAMLHFLIPNILLI